MIGDDLLARVVALASRVAGPERTPPGAGADTPLAGGGFWLDSVAVLELVMTCENEFGVVFDSEGDLTRETLGSVGSLAAAIAGKLAGRARSG